MSRDARTVCITARAALYRVLRARRSQQSREGRVEARLAHPVFPDELPHRDAGVGLGQGARDLCLGESGFLHGAGSFLYQESPASSGPISPKQVIRLFDSDQSELNEAARRPASKMARHVETTLGIRRRRTAAAVPSVLLRDQKGSRLLDRTLPDPRGVARSSS